jgi:thioredoxin 1
MRKACKAKPLKGAEETMSSEKVLVLNNESFKTEISGDKPILVDFWAQWCQPCRMMAPVVDSVADEFDGRAKIGKLNIDDFGMVAAEYGVMSIPTLILFKSGQPVERVIGVRPKEEIKKLIEKNL